MYYGIVGVTALAFACAMELVPDINEQMKLVPFTEEFKLNMTGVMLFDFGVCFVIERVLKYLFSDFRPKDIAIRREEQNLREKERKEGDKVKAAREIVAEAARKEREDDEKREAQVKAFEQRLKGRTQGRK